MNNTESIFKSTEKFMMTSKEFNDSSLLLKDILKPLEQDNKEEMEELNNLLNHIQTLIKVTENGKSLGQPILHKFNEFICENLCKESLDIIKYTTEYIIDAQKELYENKIETVCKIEILKNTLVFTISLRSDSDTYIIDYPIDNFMVIGVAENIDEAVSKKLGGKVHSRLISKAVSGTLCGEASDSVLCARSKKTYEISKINPLEYDYVLYSTSNRSVTVTSEQKSLSKLASSLTSSFVDKYEKLLWQYYNNDILRDELDSEINNLVIEYIDELRDMVNVVKSVLALDISIEQPDNYVYCSHMWSFNEINRTTRAEIVNNKIDRELNVLQGLPNLLDAFILATLVCTTYITDSIMRYLKANNITDSAEGLQIIDEMINSCADSIVEMLNDKVTKDDNMDDNEMFSLAFDAISKETDTPEGEDNEYVLSVTYKMLSFVYEFTIDSILIDLPEYRLPLFTGFDIQKENGEMLPTFNMDFIHQIQTVYYISSMKDLIKDIMSKGGNAKNTLFDMGLLDRHYILRNFKLVTDDLFS
jgi:hypothetical protein